MRPGEPPTLDAAVNLCDTLFFDPERYDLSAVGRVKLNMRLDVNTDDGSCVFDAGCITGPGNPYWLNDQCYAWVIDVDSYCCENEWDAICQQTYNYCENGFPEGFDINGMFN